MWLSPLYTHTHRFMVSSLIESRLTSTQIPFCFNHIPLLLTSQLITHARYISLPCMVFECRHNIRNQTVSTTILFSSPFCNRTTTETHHDLVKILTYMFFDTCIQLHTFFHTCFSQTDHTAINEVYFLFFIINPGQDL